MTFNDTYIYKYNTSHLIGSLKVLQTRQKKSDKNNPGVSVQMKIRD